jgi:hypothetical protein
MPRSRYELRLGVALLLFVSLASAPSSTAADPGLPNAKVTPGALNPLVSQSTVGSTICVIGYTKTIRPPASYTSPLKYHQLHSGYSVAGDTAMADYEEDHLVPLEVGGNPTSVKNLWPEPRFGSWSAAKKDRLENKMHLLVCSGQVSLAVAQKVFMQNWELGYAKYVG